MKPYADIGKRFVAMLLDGLIKGVVGFCIYIVIFNLFGWIGMSIAGILQFAFLIAYDVLLEGGSRHATFGKQIMGMMVIDEHGNGISYSKAFCRFAGKILSSLTFGIGYLIALFTEKKQALHDMIAATYVVNTEFVLDNTLYQVVGITGALAGRSFPVRREGIAIGRDPLVCQVLLPESSKGISRVHCSLAFQPNTNMFLLKDRNSTCGTFLENGTQVSAANPMALNHGDRFYLGSRNVMFEVRINAR